MGLVICEADCHVVLQLIDWRICEHSACLAIHVLFLRGAPTVNYAEAPQTSCSWLQVRSAAALGVRCGRIVSALLPAAELLMRIVMDSRHKYWQQASPSAITVRDAVEQARRLRTRDPGCLRESYLESYRQMCSIVSAQFLLGSLPLHALPSAHPGSEQCK